MDEHGIRVAIDRAQCIGNGVCAAVAPHAFALDDSMKAYAVQPDRESETALLEAARACPTQAIYLSIGDEPLYP